MSGPDPTRAEGSRLPLYQVDAFAAAVFGGNPAAVCPLEAWIDDATMQRIAEANRLSETAFVAPGGDALRIRWFTPTCEVDLCGHATLAAAFVLLECRGVPAPIRFASRSGELRVEREGERLAMDLPARRAEPREPDPGLLEALGSASPVEVRRGPYWLVALAHDPVIVTAPGEDVDFVSRFFAPSVGVDEDPVTGSAHCTLAPYWSERLGRAALVADQISARGGRLWCEARDDRVRVAGRASLYLEGTIHVPAR